MKNKISFSVCTLRTLIPCNDLDLPHLEPPHSLTPAHGPRTLFKLSLEKAFFFELGGRTVGIGVSSRYIYALLWSLFIVIYVLDCVLPRLNRQSLYDLVLSWGLISYFTGVLFNYCDLT